MARNDKPKRPPARFIGLLAPARPARAAPGYFFVHCAAEDLGRVMPAIEAAEAEGHRFWMAHRYPRTDAEIAAAADASRAVVLFLSRSPVSGALIQRVARDRKPVAPVMLDGSEAPAALRAFPSVRDAIDARAPGWQHTFRRTLEQLAHPPRRRAQATTILANPNVAEPARDPPRVYQIVSVAPALAGSRTARPQSLMQSFVNAFAAGSAVLFVFAMIQLTGGFA